MIITFQEIDIEYNESRNTWDFVLRGRNRSCESLSQAKDMIDKVPLEKKKPFPRQKAFDRIKQVEVTSFAGFSGYGSIKREEFWTIADGQRGKRYGLLAYNGRNIELIEEAKSKQKLANELRAQAEALIDECDPFKMPEDVDAE